MSARRAALVALLGAAAAGVLIRLAAATAAVLWFDEGTAGLMGRRTLAGEFLVYFHGQAYMGAVDGYLHALPFALLGSSLGALRLLPFCLSLLHVALCAVLARRVAGNGRWAAVLALAPTPDPPQVGARRAPLLLPGPDPHAPHPAPRAPRRGPRATPAGRTRTLLVAGLVAGLAWWTNLIHTIPIVVTAA